VIENYTGGLRRWSINYFELETLDAADDESIWLLAEQDMPRMTLGWANARAG